MTTADALLRSLRRGDDHTAALVDDAERARLADHEEQGRQLETLAPFTRGTEGLVVGTTLLPDGREAPVRIPHRIAHGLGAWLMGATGSGKTTALTAWTAPDLGRPGIVPIVLDFKGDYATNIAGTMVPHRALGLPPDQGAEFLARLRVWAPWRNRTIPSLHLTASGGAIARRAVALTDLFVATVGAGELGTRQMSAFVPSVKLLMRTGVPFTLLPDVLAVPGFRRALLLAAEDPELDAYFRNRFEADAREGVVGSISARFDRFVADDVTKLALFGPHGFDPEAWLESGTTVVNLGGGLRTHREFWASFLLHTLVEGILSRQPNRASPKVVVRVDEAQLAIPTDAQAKELDDALSLMRSKKACLWIAHQHAGQLNSYPALLQSLRTNVGWMGCMRVPEEAVAASACVTPEGLPPGIDGEGLTEPVIRKAWEAALASLPNKSLLLQVPLLAPSSIPVRVLELDVDALSRTVPSDIRELALEGQDGIPREELAEREERWRRLVQELAEVAEPNRDALLRTADGANGGPRRRGRAPRGGSMEIG